LGRSED